MAAAARDVGAAASDALREAASGRASAEARAAALERELAASRAAADTERADHAAALERARKQAADERSRCASRALRSHAPHTPPRLSSKALRFLRLCPDAPHPCARLLRELEAARAQAMQLRGSDLEAASLRSALSGAEGRAATALSAAAAAAASFAALEAKHTEIRSNYHRLYRKVMASAPELVGKARATGAAPSPAQPALQPLMAHVEAALPSLLPSPTPAPRPVEAPPAAEEVEEAAPAAEAEAVAAAPARLPRPPVYDTVESDWVIRSTPDEQLQAMATADAAAAAAVACLPETNAGEDEDDEEDAPPMGDDDAAGGDADAAPSSEVTQCCAAAARGQPCAHRAGGWGHPVPVPRAAAPPPAPPPQLPPPAVPAEKPWRKRGAAAAGFLTDPVPRSSAKRDRPAAAPAAGDDDARYLFTPPPDDADAAAAPGPARPPVALRDCSPLALPSPPSGARTVWTLEAAAPQPRAGGGRRARPANERPAPPGGRYAEVERNRDARAAMPAFECVECAGFYAAMGVHGAPQQPCSHGRGGPAAAPGPTSHEEHLKHVGRHRAQWAPALTPAGFWDIGFADDPAPPPPEERMGVTKPINYCPGL